MKTIMITFLVCFLYSGLTVNSQTKNDSLSIEKACRDYVEGWAEGDAERVARGVSPELVKRSVSSDRDGMSFTNIMSASLLMIVTKANREGVKAKDLEPGKPFKLDVTISDITGDLAMAKAVNTKYGFFDYCQLAKYNGEWKIFNVLWGWLPKESEKP